MVLRYFALFMALVFICFAGVQYNDPDPLIWIPIYLYAVVLSVLYFRNKGNKVLFLISAVIYLAGAIYMWPEQWEGVALQNGMKTVNIEEGRESLGLAVVFITFLVYGLNARISRKPLY